MEFTKIESKFKICKPTGKYPNYKMPNMLIYGVVWQYLDELEDSLIAVSENNYLELRKKCRDIYKHFGLAVNWQDLTLRETSTIKLLESSEIAPPEIYNYYSSISNKYHDLYTALGKWHKEHLKKENQP